ncbi:hypothetical protein ACLOJK_005535 [Asimina triloba]
MKADSAQKHNLVVESIIKDTTVKYWISQILTFAAKQDRRFPEEQKRVTRKSTKTTATPDASIENSRSSGGAHQLVFIIPLLGLAVVFFDVLGYQDSGVGELFDVGDVVVLSYVNPASSSQQEGETAPYNPHPSPQPPSLCFLRWGEQDRHGSL